jgi:hypothetical protein
MDSIRIWGLIITVLLVVSLVVGIFGMAGGTMMESFKENTIKNNYTLSDAQMDGVNRVNINYVGNVSSFGLRFSNQNDNLYNISVRRDINSKEPNITYTKNGDVLDVNISVDQGSSEIVLGNRATYNGNFETKLGGYGFYMGNNSKVDNLRANIKYFGGGMVILGDTTFQKLDLNVNTGGFMITSMANKTTNGGNITANTLIGGVSINTKPSSAMGVKIKGTADLGGFNFNPSDFNVLTNSTTQLDVESAGYSDKPTKLLIESNVGLGGININMYDFFPMYTE